MQFNKHCFYAWKGTAQYFFHLASLSFVETTVAVSTSPSAIILQKGHSTVSFKIFLKVVWICMTQNNKSTWPLWKYLAWFRYVLLSGMGWNDGGQPRESSWTINLWTSNPGKNLHPLCMRNNLSGTVLLTTLLQMYVSRLTLAQFSVQFFMCRNIACSPQFCDIRCRS